MPPPRPMIQVHQLTKMYGPRVAVDALTFSVQPGEIVGMVGPNGAGKTTTLRAIAGVHPPTMGRILVGGHDIVADSVAAKRQLALVPDEPHLFGSLTVWEHLRFTAAVYRVSEWEPRAMALLQELEMEDRRDSMADELSRGMRQKVAVACGLLHEPSVLMFDEPLTGLDPRGIRTLYGAMRRRAAGGAAVVLSSHLLGQIEGLCTSFLILREGRLVFRGTTEALRDRFAPGESATLEDIFFRATEGAGAEAGG